MGLPILDKLERVKEAPKSLIEDLLADIRVSLMAVKTSVRNGLVDALVNQTNFTAFTAVYVSLHTADPGDTGASEASGSSYARVVATTKFPAASSGASINDVAIAFAAFSGSFTFTHVGLWDAITTGNWIGGGSLLATKSVSSGDTASFAVGALTVEIL